MGRLSCRSRSSDAAPNPVAGVIIRIVEVHFERGRPAMTSNRSAPAPSVVRGVGRSYRRLSTSLALLGLALVGLLQTGCRSAGCSDCNIGSKITNGVQSLSARIFPGNRGGCNTCGTLGTVEEGVIVDQGIPIAAPGVVGVPAPAVIAPTPAPEPAAVDLQPIPPPATSSRSQGGTNRSAYVPAESRSGMIASRQGSDLSRAYQITAPRAAAFSPGDEPDVFDHLPPVDIPADLPRQVISPEPAAIPSGDSQTSSPPKSAPVEPANIDPTSTAASVRATPGVARSAAVAAGVAGGSLPAVEGLAWLKEKGYRTFVDLRPRAEVDADFPDLVSDQGLLYVALPISISPINLTRVNRFNDLLAQADQRPLYFCDGEGRRAGLLWYLHLRSQDHLDASQAQPKAELIGLLPKDVETAERFLKLNFANASGPSSSTEIEPKLMAAVLPQTLAVPALPPTPAPDSIAPQSYPDIPISIYVEPAKPKAVVVRSDEVSAGQPSWKPVAALVLSGLGVPLAYWSRSTLSRGRGPRRASLTAKGPGPRKALPLSGV